MKREKIITILTPAYNSEKYIKRCIDSVISQTYHNWEMIIINDGSTDATESIVSKYVMGDKRIRIYSQKNFGYVYTINRLISLSKSIYFFELDSDNWLNDNNVLYGIVNIIKKYNPDIITLPNLEICEKSNKIYKITPNNPIERYCRNYNEVCNEIIAKNVFCYSHSGNAIKKQLVNDLKMVGDPRGADTRFFCAVLARCNSLYCLKNEMMCFGVREDSLSHRRFGIEHKIKWLFDDHIFFKYYYEENKKKKYLFPQLIIHLNIYCDCLSYHGKNYKDSIKRCGKEIWKHRLLFKGIYPTIKLFLITKFTTVFHIYYRFLNK